MNNHKKIRIAIGLYVLCFSLLFSCKKEIKPIDILAPERVIDSSAMKAYKSNLDTRYVAMGFMYGWGTSDASILMHTPDSLDVIILKDGYDSLSSAQIQDLQEVRSKKATKVLISFDLSTNFIDVSAIQDTILNRQARLYYKMLDNGDGFDEIRVALDKVMTDTETELKDSSAKIYIGLLNKAQSLITKYSYDGLSVLLPTNSSYFKDALNNALQNLGTDYGIGQKYILVLESPDTIYSANIKKANWLVYGKQTPDFYLSYFDRDAALYPTSRYIPSADFSSSSDASGYADSQTFGSNGILPRTIDVVNWYANNKGGVALFHIEKNYNDISGNTTYMALRQIIQSLQKSKK